MTAHADALACGEGGDEAPPPPPPPSTTIPTLKQRAAATPPADRVPAVLASTPGAVPALVRAVAYAASWRARAWPAMAAAVVGGGGGEKDGRGERSQASLAAEAALFQEPAASSLLALVLLSDVPSALLFGGKGGDDAALDAAAWAVGAVGWLDGETGGRAAGRAATTAAASAALADPAAAAADAAFSATLAALGALRGLAQRASDLGPGVADRLAGGGGGGGGWGGSGALPHLASLLACPPWEARRPASKARPPSVLRRGGSGWVELSPAQAAAMLPPHAGHAWLATLWLVAGPAFAARGESAWAGGSGGGAALAARLAAALRAPGPHHDALPPLAGLLLPALEGVMAVAGRGGASGGGPLASAAAVAAAAAGGGASIHPPPSTSSSSLLIQEMPTPLARVLDGMDWDGLAGECAAALCAGGEGAGDGLRAVADALAAEPRLAGGRPEGKEAAGSATEELSVRVWARGSMSSALTLRLARAPDGSPEAVRVEGAGSDGEGGPRPRVRGVRTRLTAVPPPSPALLPPAGRLLTTVAGRALEATYELPGVGEGAAGGGGRAGLDSLPPGVWVTAGLLAADGVALQLRLKRVGGADAKRAPGGAGWAVYVCVGGALTVRVKEK